MPSGRFAEQYVFFRKIDLSGFRHPRPDFFQLFDGSQPQPFATMNLFPSHGGHDPSVVNWTATIPSLTDFSASNRHTFFIRAARKNGTPYGAKMKLKAAEISVLLR